MVLYIFIWSKAIFQPSSLAKHFKCPKESDLTSSRRSELRPDEPLSFEAVWGSLKCYWQTSTRPPCCFSSKRRPFPTVLSLPPGPDGTVVLWRSSFWRSRRSSWPEWPAGSCSLLPRRWLSSSRLSAPQGSRFFQISKTGGQNREEFCYFPKPPNFGGFRATIWSQFCPSTWTWPLICYISAAVGP